MDRIRIEGGRRLEGQVKISGAKNAALPILFSALLVDGASTFTNVPSLMDVHSTIMLLSTLGVTVDKTGDRVEVDATGLNKYQAPYDLVRKMRASVLALGPLVARLGRAQVSLPGGCAIGARPINLHLKGLAALGADIRLEHGYVEARAKRLKGAEVYFDTVTVTGTENILMAAVLAEGRSTLHNAACEPEVVALADVLLQMGAHIEGAGTSEITVEGVNRLQPAKVRIIPDRIEAGTFMVGAALTGGTVRLLGCEPGHLDAVIQKIQLAGARVTTKDDWIEVQGAPVIQSTDVDTLPYPGFPTDMQAQFMVLMSVANGVSIISENIFENRFIHVVELQRMGADITLSGRSAMVKGVPHLSGAPVMASDLRASASLILAGLVAEGQTQVNRVYHLDRGYDALERKFAQLGAAIERIRD
jgi:UDP-N-acetylglucosamine 1-carboxyvinyltransferase